jgi:hypothetical protein
MATGPTWASSGPSPAAAPWSTGGGAGPRDAWSDWVTVAVWLRTGGVARVMVNLLADDNPGDLPGALAEVYGAPGSTRRAW